MLRVRALSMLALLAVAGCSSRTPHAPVSVESRNPTPAGGADRSSPTPAARLAAAAINAFGLELYARASKRGGNLVLSPPSAAIVLAMTAAGARGETHAELARALGLDTLPDPDAAFEALLQVLEQRESSATLLVSQRLFAQRGYAFREDFLARLRDRYAAPLGEVDFAGALEQARGAINEWVATETQKSIPELLPQGALTEDARLVLASALYFKGEWQRAFDEEQTKPGSFMTDRQAVIAPLMHQKGEFAYGRVHAAQLLELPFRGGLSMLVILPDAVDGLSAIEKRMVLGYERWLRSLTKRTVDVVLPRWKAGSTLDLGGPLADMGLRRAFGPGADFSLMARAGSQPLYIGTVLQQARVEVSEQGAQAAAGSAVALYGLEHRDEPNFHAVRPFLYFLREERTGTILFVGRVLDPR